MVHTITEFIASGPFAAVYAFLVLVVAFRSTATYGLGRYAHYLIMHAREPASGWRRRIWNWAHSQGTQRAVSQLQARGWIAIPFAFLTVGVQSVIMLAAGVIGLSLPRFALAAVPGWLAWAAIYSTIGFAMWGAVLAAAAGSPAGLALIGTLLIGGIAWMAWRRTHAQSRAD
ncbi:MAG: hypothetical protein LKJ57_06320 [Ancrocorticia sp.]|jgi:membrane protein DedA with SNARE-associated domain|nr:hypothetical protein [Ancrocorticia sp.]MCI1896351.1 hypothetical protein [Ancrocorticia sp.]MCI1933087.1 hypothetical protein [Ancrocorticia sp.]MCI2013195.1 hypothetical protein [Ancrocorticia sp.]MCI2028712.1 hypothetical protein [Ancrocorticia sp.]